MALPGLSVKSRVKRFEAQREPRGCGCCSLPDTGDPARSRRRGCSSPTPSRGSSPARAQPGAPGPQSRGRPGAGRRDLDKTLLSLLLIFHSSSAGSMIAIDNKIEQAMDLVKSHLMLAVREEVEVLREQIKDLAERNAALEWENGLLRALASPEQLSQLQSQLRRPSA